MQGIVYYINLERLPIGDEGDLLYLCAKAVLSDNISTFEIHQCNECKEYCTQLETEELCTTCYEKRYVDCEYCRTEIDTQEHLYFEIGERFYCKDCVKTHNN